MSAVEIRTSTLAHLRRGGHLTLFLDYDGTLVPIAPTPAKAMPDRALLSLLTRLAGNQNLRTVILSGRMLSSLEQMLPITHLILAGIYGYEVRLNGSALRRGLPVNELRASITDVEKGWRAVISGLPGFLLEDKGAAIALHARWASERDAGRVLAAARDIAKRSIGSGRLRIVDGHRFLEVAPAEADKAQTVDWFLQEYPVSNDLLLYFGDDNKDEGAFEAIHRRGGVAIGVGDAYPLPEADVHLESPSEVRKWLEQIAATA